MIVFRLANSLNMVQMDKFKRAVAIGYLEKGYRPSHIAKDLEVQPQQGVIASSGVEKVVKLWSILPLPDKEDVARNKREEQERRVYSHEEYIGLVLRSGSMISHFYVICVCVGGLENKD